MADLDQVLADVQAEATLIAGISTFVDGLKKQLADALVGVTLPAAVQAKIDAVFAGVEANKGALASAMATDASGASTAPAAADPAAADPAAPAA